MSLHRQIASLEHERRRLASARVKGGLSKPEPPPKPNDSKPIWFLVIEDMHSRHRAGVKKYGTPLQAHNGRDALTDAYQEALDLVVYLRQAIEERGK